MMHSKIPTICANSIASSVYNGSSGLTMLPNTLDTMRDVSATGPMASWRDDPKMAYTNIGAKPESEQTRIKINHSAYIHHGIEQVVDTIRLPKQRVNINNLQAPSN